jgi:large-conductance mechanosensitive channel
VRVHQMAVTRREVQILSAAYNYGVLVHGVVSFLIITAVLFLDASHVLGKDLHQGFAPRRCIGNML